MVTKLHRIVGDPGVGKSDTCKELEHRGYHSSDIDRDGLATPFNLATGEAAERFVDTPEWHSQHGWKLVESKIDAIRIATDDEIAFVCGTVTDDSRLNHKFDTFFALSADEETIRHRLRKRALEEHADNTYGDTQEMEDRVVANMSRREALYRSMGAIFIDATQPTAVIVDQVLEHTL